MSDPIQPAPDPSQPPAANPAAQPPAATPAPQESNPAEQQWNPPPVPPAPSGFAQPAPSGFTQPDWNAAATNVRNFDPKSLAPLDLVIMGLGVLGFLLSFGSFYKYSVKVTAGAVGVSFRASGTVSAWHGFFGWFGVVCGLVAALLLAASLVAKIPLPFNVRQVAFGSAGVGALCLLLALVIVPGNTAGSAAFGVRIDKGHGWAFWLVLLMSLAEAGLAWKRYQESSSS